MEFIEHLKKYLSEKQIEKLISALNKDESKHALILNLDKISDEEFINKFPNVKNHPIVPHCYIYNKDQYEFGKSIYYEMGYYYIFEPCSALVSHFLNPTKDDIVLDIAAAPGGKSLHTSILMENEGLLLSNEINLSRSYILSSNVERMGRKNIVVINNTIDDLHKKYQNYFTKIILDAPCSGSGMFRKNDLMEKDWTYQKVLSLVPIQKDLLLKAYDMLVPGGKLVYSTCSFSYEEDEEVIIDLLSKTDATIEDINIDDTFYQSESKIGIHLFPHLFDGEGHYICKIAKPLNDEQRSFDKNIKDNFDNIRKLCYLKNGYIYKNNDAYYYLNKYIDLKGLHIIRGGLKLGVLEKYGFEYDHALSKYLKEFDNVVSLNLDQAKSYLEGNQINIESKKGICLLTYEGNPLGMGKSSNNRINNKYPKGLRIKL
jgi:NOL1/NOP2/sun family putative RNA methylase